jgi:hypothetical protein
VQIGPAEASGAYPHDHIKGPGDLRVIDLV